jgi:hypothetical protein
MIVEGNGFSYALENRLVSKLNILIDRITNKKQKLDAWLAIHGSEGCLTGDTKIKVSRFKATRTYTLKQLYERYNNKVKRFDMRELSRVRSFNGKEIRLHTISNVIYSGKKKVYILKLENGSSIKATATHMFLKQSNEWTELSQLNIGDLLMCDTLNPESKNRKRIKLYDIQLQVGKNHPYTSTTGRIEVHRLIYESYINKLYFTEYLDILLNESEQCKSLMFIDPQVYEIHHKDGNHYNNSIDNLELLKKEQHRLEHGTYANFSQGVPKFSKIISIEPLGEEDVYDIQCEEPYHNFVANNIVVHNSGKSGTSTAIAYYMKQKTGKDVHLFFRLDGMIKLATESVGKIFIWDEPSLDSLSTDQLKKIGRDLLRFAMTIRKKRHTFIINFTKFWKFPEYLVVDRCLGMVHMYSKNEIEMGRFVYIKKKNLETLWNEYQKGKKRSYYKLKSFRGNFPDIMEEHFDKMDFWVENVPHATYRDYERLKDIAINSIGKIDETASKAVNKLRKELNTLKGRIARLDIKNIKTKEDLARAIKVHPKSLLLWTKNPEETPDSLGNQGFESNVEQHINISRVNIKENHLTEGEREIIEAEKESNDEETTENQPDNSEDTTKNN